MIDVRHFKMETPASILAAVTKGQWMTSIDLSDAYFHVPIHYVSRKYLRFVFLGVVYQFRAHCFGISTARMIFTQVMKPVVTLAHREGILLHQYVDDWLCAAKTAEQATQPTKRLPPGWD